jgi:hypothetical protein
VSSACRPPRRDRAADHLLSEPEAVARSVATDAELIGRAKDVEIAELALLDAAAGRGRTLIVSGPPGVRKTALLEAITAQALSFRVGAGTAAPVEGSWPYARRRGARRRLPAPSHLLDGLADHHREEIDRACRHGDAVGGGSSHQRLFVAVAELVRLATARMASVDDRRHPRCGRRRPSAAALRPAVDRIRSACIVLSHRTTPMSETLAETRQSLLDRHSGGHRARPAERRESRCSSLATSTARLPSSGRITALSRGSRSR